MHTAAATVSNAHQEAKLSAETESDLLNASPNLLAMADDSSSYLLCFNNYRPMTSQQYNVTRKHRQSYRHSDPRWQRPQVAQRHIGLRDIDHGH